MLRSGFDVLDAWGFRFATSGVWVKRTIHNSLAFGTGYRSQPDAQGMSSPRDVGLIKWRFNKMPVGPDRRIRDAAPDASGRARDDRCLTVEKSH